MYYKYYSLLLISGWMVLLILVYNMMGASQVLPIFMFVKINTISLVLTVDSTILMKCNLSNIKVCKNPVLCISISTWVEPILVILAKRRVQFRQISSRGK